MCVQLGAGLKAIQIKEHREMETTCFFVVRTDGSVDDVSYRKCAPCRPWPAMPREDSPVFAT